MKNKASVELRVTVFLWGVEESGGWAESPQQEGFPFQEKPVSWRLIWSSGGGCPHHSLPRGPGPGALI